MSAAKEPFWADEPIAPHHHDAEWAELTSAELAAFGSGHTKGQMMVMLRSSSDGMTDWEMTHERSREAGHTVSHDSTKAMRNTLMRQGWVLPTGQHRPGPFGSPNEVWKAIARGVEPIPIPRGQKRPSPCLHEHLQPTYLEADEWRKDCTDCGETVRRMSVQDAAKLARQRATKDLP